MMHEGPAARSFVLHVVRTNFGEICEEVVGQLFDQGARTLKEICRSLGDCGIEFENHSCSGGKIVSAALQILLQFGFVTASKLFSSVHGKVGLGTSFSYSLNVNAVIGVIWYPMYPMLVNTLFSLEGGVNSLEVCARIVQCFLKNGRMSIKQLLYSLSQGDTIRESPESIKLAFQYLVSVKVVKQAVSCSAIQHNSSNYKKQGQKNLMVVKNDILGKKLDMVQDSTTHDLPKELSLSCGFTKNLNDYLFEDTSILWQLCQTALQDKVKHNLCVKYLSQKLGVKFGDLVRAMTQVSISGIDLCTQCTDFKTPLEIKQRINSLQAKSTLTISDTEFLLMDACREFPNLFKSSQTLSSMSYGINTQSILINLKVKEIQALVLRRFGIEGLRIWNCVLDLKFSESKTIRERCLMPHQQVREILYNFLRHGFVSLQEVSRTSDHAPSKTIYLWHINLKDLFKKCSSCMLRALFNIQIRLSFELSKRQKLMKAINKGDVIAMKNFSEDVLMLRKTIAQLDCQTLLLAPSITLMNG